MKGLILAGGRGTRLRPITHTGPKQLIPVANKTVLEYAIEDLKEVGIDEIGVVLGNLGRDEIQALLGDGSDYGVDITYIVQGNPLGLAHAAGCARDFISDDDFVMYLGDNMLKQGIVDLVGSYESGDYDAGIALQQVDNPSQFGLAEVDGEGEVVRLVEKPDDPPSNLALIGIYIFSPAIFDAIDAIEPSWRDELEITDAIQWLLEEGLSVDSRIIEGWWKDTGKPEDIIEANRLVLDEQEGGVEGTVEEGAEVVGYIDLHEDAVIEDGAVVRGPVSIGEGTVVKSDTYVGPYTSIGSDSVVENVQIENSVIVGESRITTSGKITDSLVGRGAEVESAEGMLPEGRRLIIGENSKLRL
jgi:glucose-1-phosphate thymidylyltransferase